MQAQFVHVNIIARDWRALARFYQEVFGCSPVPPEWLARGTGVAGAAFQGMHLRLPGNGPDGPTLEIYQYSANMPRSFPVAANREGISHLAFRVDNVALALEAILRHGGSAAGEIVEHEVAGVGVLTFTYALDPEGNILELQHWR